MCIVVGVLTCVVFSVCDGGTYEFEGVSVFYGAPSRHTRRLGCICGLSEVKWQHGEHSWFTLHDRRSLSIADSHSSSRYVKFQLSCELASLSCPSLGARMCKDESPDLLSALGKVLLLRRKGLALICSCSGTTASHLLNISLKRSISQQLATFKQLKAGSFSQYFVSRLGRQPQLCL